jgi:DNA repair protein RadC
MSARIEDLPEEDRPRERLLRIGAHALSDAELVGIFIHTGLPGENAIAVATRLIREQGSLRALARAMPQRLMKIKGLGQAKAATLAAAFELGRRAAEEESRSEPLSSPEQIYRYFQGRLAHLNYEEMHVALLDVKHSIIRTELVSKGGPAETPNNLREILRLALLYSAYSVVIVHNHPSGDPSPSRADVAATRSICEAADLVGLLVMDHVIIGQPSSLRTQAWFSFRQGGLMKER